MRIRRESRARTAGQNRVEVKRAEKPELQKPLEKQDRVEATPVTLGALAGGNPVSTSTVQVNQVGGNTVMGARLGLAEVKPVGPKELSLQETLDFAAGFSSGVLFVGFGSKNQFAAPDSVRRQVDAVVARQNELYGEGKWFATFGGDPLNEDKPDIAIVAKRLIDLGVPTLAVQSDVVRDEWGGVDKHIPVVHYVPTDRDASGQIQWGGLDADGALLGPSKVYLGPLADHLSDLALFGGGDIAAQEVLRARELGLSIIDCPADAKNPTGPLRGASEALFPTHRAGDVYFDS